MFVSVALVGVVLRLAAGELSEDWLLALESEHSSTPDECESFGFADNEVEDWAFDKYFACRDNSSCINLSQLCDRVVDCLDYSDESREACELMANSGVEIGVEYPKEPHKPEADEFLCNDGYWWTKKKYLCDGQGDCPEWEDEQSHHCKNQECYAGTQECGGRLKKACLNDDWFCDWENTKWEWKLKVSLDDWLRKPRGIINNHLLKIRTADELA